MVIRSGGSGGWGPPATFSLPNPTGLIFPSNNAANSDIRLLWSGANLLPRTAHTVIWLVKYVQQNGYYAVTWHSPNDGTWDFGAYSVGMHPYPCDGGFNAGGNATGGTGDAGTVHYGEIAGCNGAFDFIASSSTPGPQDTFLTTKGVWYTQARSVVISGSDLVHTYWPDVGSNPTKFITQKFATASLGSGGVAPAFYIGASDWRATGNTNDETISGTVRGIRLFSAALVIADIQTEVAAIGNNAAASSAGQAATWYINDNPTPTDVTDKSAAGHSPSWANANRPTLYTG
jgi:hypothetical protein